MRGNRVKSQALISYSTRHSSHWQPKMRWTLVNDLSACNTAIVKKLTVHFRFPPTQDQSYFLTKPNYNRLPLMFTVLNKLGKLCKVSGTVYADPDEFENAHILVQKGLSYIAKNTHFRAHFRKVPFTKMFSNKTKAQTWRFQTEIQIDFRFGRTIARD